MFPYTYNFVMWETFHLNVRHENTCTRHENTCLLSGLLRCSVDNQFIFVECYWASELSKCFRKIILFIVFSVMYLIRRNEMQISTEFVPFISVLSSQICNPLEFFLSTVLVQNFSLNFSSKNQYCPDLSLLQKVNGEKKLLGKLKINC